MVIFEKSNAGLLGVPVNNIIEVNPKEDSSDCWLKYWDGKEVRTCVVVQSIEEIQYRMFIARHGKKPTKGLLE